MRARAYMRVVYCVRACVRLSACAPVRVRQDLNAAVRPEIHEETSELVFTLPDKGAYTFTMSTPEVKNHPGTGQDLPYMTQSVSVRFV